MLSAEKKQYLFNKNRIKVISLHSLTDFFLSLKINFVFANSADRDEMLHHVAFNLGLH